jgi:alpha-tubulin suppressor-like RCC1 family protein
LGREVAVKVVRPRFHADEESVARLAREARTVAQLEHPNIVSLHAVKRLNNGLALVMQIVPGHTLKAELARGPLPIDRAEQVLRDISRALAYAHRCGVVHRDVKPENIFLDEITGRALLSDFGVARSITENSELTATGTAIGTPTYMSPEQIDGGALDGRSDLYALGMVAWEMLSGRRPWFGESLYSVIYRQKHDALPPLDLVRDDVPPRLQYLIEGLMHKRPADRWPGAAPFLSMIGSSDKLPGFKAWQSTAKKRRKAGYRPLPAPADVSPSSSTVHFRREGGGSGSTTIESANAQSITPHPASSGGLRVDGRTWSPPRGTGVHPMHGKSRRRRAMGWTAVAAASAVAAIALWPREPAQPPALAATTIPGDRAGVEVPVLPAADTSIAAGTIDSLALGVTGTPPPGDSAPPPPPAVATNPRPNPAPPSTSPATTPVPAAGVPPRPVATATPTDTAPTPATAARMSFPSDRGVIAVGQTHSCWVDRSGRAACWGNNENGQLGDGTGDSRPTATAVAGDFAFAGLSAGQAHTCGITSDGDALCWGGNSFGQLGDGTTSPRSAPVRVAGSAEYSLVRAGQNHTCGLTRGGTVRCWGANTRGQLGDGSRAGRSSPVSVSLGSPAGALSLGSAHTCAVTVTGEGFCWGRNDYGQLGHGTKEDQATPQLVATDKKFVSIAAGSSHTCAVAEDGTAYCWGRNQYGQLGLGTTADAATPQPVESGATFATVTLGVGHSCGRSRDGRAFCWGRNFSGQLGDGTFEDRSRPVAVRMTGTFTSLSASGSHTCGATAGGDAFCWGYNVNGQLGVGDRDNANTPGRVTPAPR